VIEDIERQIRESRHMIERSQTLVRLGHEEVARSKLIIADARRIMDAVRADPEPRPDCIHDPTGGDDRE
jgi:hypothetical protein